MDSVLKSRRLKSPFPMCYLIIALLVVTAIHVQFIIFWSMYNKVYSDSNSDANKDNIKTKSNSNPHKGDSPEVDEIGNTSNWNWKYRHEIEIQSKISGIQNDNEIDMKMRNKNFGEGVGGVEHYFELERKLGFFNELGSQRQQTDVAPDSVSYYENLMIVLKNVNDPKLELMSKTLLKKYRIIQEKKRHTGSGTSKHRHQINGTSTHKKIKSIKTIKITTASIACGDGSYQLLQTMIKSAVLFSQDAALHSIVFVDQDSLIDVAMALLETKWTADAKCWDFTFEMHLEWFPQINDVNWKSMFAKCATQRLFFPSLLPHIDALIFLDLDTIIISNLTELWLHIPNVMRNDKLAAMAPNNEPTASSWYDGNEVPHYGLKGLNAGVMLMNLTQMREFNFEEKSIGTQALYGEHIKLADQDILNIIFNVFPEKLLELGCSYNFNWVHCGGPILRCVNDGTRENRCFCQSAKKDGVKLIHGNGGTFSSNYAHHLFLPQLHSAIQKLDLIMHSVELMIQNLKASFTKLNPQPCYPLSPDLLYGNAEEYLRNLKRIM